jgi:prepilin-type N-terminal cleavage/methylation domain-containing protein
MRTGNRGRGPDAGKGHGGFTLVELLVVIVIIAILAGLVTVGISAAMTSARASATEAFLQGLAGACAQYAQRWGDFPPSSLEELGGSSPNDTNSGAEALVACLASEKRGGKLLSADEELLSNTDNDASSKGNVTGWYFGDNKLREVVDRNGYVITYLHHRDYAKPRAGVLKYRLSADLSETSSLAPEKSAATSTWVGAGRFQLRSAGKDGKLGTPDDIRGGQ